MKSFLNKPFGLAIVTVATLMFACSPEREDQINLPAVGSAPEFSITPIPSDSNRFVVKDLSTGNFQRFGIFPEAVLQLLRRLWILCFITKKEITA